MSTTKGTLKILGPSGHEALAWESLNDDTRLEAEQTFKALTGDIGNRYTGYLMDDKKVGHKVDKLPESGTVVLVPRLVGG